jgi:HAD superfamily hydrolase (TIGR01509 family)
MGALMIDAILFDLDGTLIDTESVALKAGHAAFGDLGVGVDMALMHCLVGVDQPTSRKIIQASLPDLDIAQLAQAWDARFNAAILQDLPLKVGAVDLLGLALRPMAIVTSSGQDAAHHKLRLAQIDHHFQHVVTVADVARPKPAPEPYLLAAQKLGVSPTRCLVFEDSETGAEAAYRAGCIVVQVPDIVPTKGRWAHHVAADLLAGARHFGLI